MSIIMNTYGEGALRSSDTRHNTKSNTNARAGTGLDWTQGTDLARGVQKLGAELLVGGGRGARRAGALVGHLLQPLREAPVDRGLPLVDVELAGAVRVEVVQRLLEARGHEQKLQVLLAARLQEVDHVLRTARSVTRSFGCSCKITESSQVEGRPVVGRRVRDLVLLHGRDDLISAQRAAAVLVDHLEALARGVLEIVRKFLDLLVGLLGLELALGRPFRELVREGDLDALLPAWNIDR